MNKSLINRILCLKCKTRKLEILFLFCVKQLRIDAQYSDKVLTRRIFERDLPTKAHFTLTNAGKFANDMQLIYKNFQLEPYKSRDGLLPLNSYPSNI